MRRRANNDFLDLKWLLVRGQRDAKVRDQHRRPGSISKTLSGREMKPIPMEDAISQLRPIGEHYYEMAHFLSR